MEAFNRACFSTGVGFGLLVNLSSYSTFRSDFARFRFFNARIYMYPINSCHFRPAIIVFTLDTVFNLLGTVVFLCAVGLVRPTFPGDSVADIVGG